MSRSVRRFAVLAGAFALTGLTGCGTHPDTGVVSGQVSISLKDVNSATDAMCSDAAAEQRGGQGPRGYVRSLVAGLQATRALVEEYRAEVGMTPQASETAALNAQVSQLEGRGLSDARLLAEVLNTPTYFTSTAFFTSAQAHQRAGTPLDPSNQSAVYQAVQEGAMAFQTWLAGRTVDFDPRLRLRGTDITLAQDPSAVNPLVFAPTDTGSVALTEVATQTVDPQAAFAALGKLSPHQVCGS